MDDDLLAGDGLPALLKAQGVDVDDDVVLASVAAVGVTMLLWRNTAVEDWHARSWGLSDGEMMRANSATVRFVRERVSVSGTDWDLVARDVADGDRVLPDSRTLAKYAGRGRVRELRHEARANVVTLASMQEQFGPRRALMVASVSSVGCRWHGMPVWGRVVDEFVRIVQDPDDDHWDVISLEQVGSRPADIKDVEALRRTLLAGPDLLSAAAAQWCVRALLGYVRL